MLKLGVAQTLPPLGTGFGDGVGDGDGDGVGEGEGDGDGDGEGLAVGAGLAGASGLPGDPPAVRLTLSSQKVVVRAPRLNTISVSGSVDAAGVNGTVKCCQVVVALTVCCA